MFDFRLLRLYTRREISDKLSGGVQDYLPHRSVRSRELDRQILGAFLVESAPIPTRTGGFMASALAISGSQLARDRVGRLITELAAVQNNAIAIYDFWVAEVTKAHAWYVAHPE